MTNPIKLVSWNIAHREEAWRFLTMQGYDLALLQEAASPPSDLELPLVAGDAPWALGGAGIARRWRSAVVGLSDRVEVRHLPVSGIDAADSHTVAVSRAGTLAVAEITVRATGERFHVASMYGAWESPMGDEERREIYADASVHRLISDLSTLVYRERAHRVIAAGDLNVLRGYGERGSPYWRDRYATVFHRMDAIGLPCVGPELAAGAAPRNPPPDERPSDSRTVPTFRVRIADPSSASRQLDFVFASRVLDAADQWGPSDHCRIEIDLEPDAGGRSSGALAG
jgi:hypothetical protein